MRVGVLTYALDRPLTGIGRYTVEFVRALSRLDHDITLLTAGGPGPLADIAHERLPGCERLPALMTLGSIQIARAAQRHQFDILHDTTGVTPFGLLPPAVHSVVTVHDVIPWSYPGVSTLLDTLIYRRWLPRILPNMSAICTVSECSRKDIAHYLHIPPDRIHNTSEGIGTQYTPAPPAEVNQVRDRFARSSRYVLYVGSDEERKNLPGLLQSYAMIRERGVTQTLVIVGPNQWHHHETTQMLADLGLEEHVSVTGYVSEEELIALYTGADVFVFPSFYEGFGLPVLEAMACGAPVITSNCSSLPEVAGDAAILIDPADTEALAAQIMNVLNDPALAQSMRERGWLRTSMFSWDQCAKAVSEVYERLSETTDHRSQTL